MRISKHVYYLELAKTVTLRSTCLRRNYGAVIVNQDHIISTGYNGAPRGQENCCDRGTCPRLSSNTPHNSGTYSECSSVHAEQNAIISASREEMIGAKLYLAGEEYDSDVYSNSGEYTYKRMSNCSPCPVCWRLIENSGIIKVVG